MRYLLSLILSLALLGTGPVLGQIKKEVSQITESTRLVSKSMRDLVGASYPGHGSFRAAYENPPEKAPIWTLTFFGFAKEKTAMTAASSVRLQADGQTISPLDVESRTRTLDNSILEIKETTFTRADFATIATAKSVSATIGPMVADTDLAVAIVVKSARVKVVSLISRMELSRFRVRDSTSSGRIVCPSACRRTDEAAVIAVFSSAKPKNVSFQIGAFFGGFS